MMAQKSQDKNNLDHKVDKDAKPDSETNTEEVIEDSWLIRDCEVYRDEYDECTSFKGRFHQYFIYGETLDCNQWKRDCDNCYKWVDSKDVKAGEAVITSEKNRRMERFRAHYRNDIWKKRELPPDDWSAPLPEWMAKRDENTYLAQKAKEMREGTETDEKESTCSIM